MIINMTTIAVRKKHYIDRTLESLFRSDGGHLPLNLILGSNDSSHVEKYRDRATIVAWGPEWEAKAKPGEMRHNCNLNALRALQYGDDEHCLCCEDDIQFKEDWYSQLLLTIEQIGHRDYVLSLGQGCDQSPDKRYAVHTRPSLVGAQAIFYPSNEIRTAVADYLEGAVVDCLERRGFRGTNDHLIGRYAKTYAALYNTTPMLVGHIGQVSSFSGQPQVPKALAPARPPVVERSAAAAPRPVAGRIPDAVRNKATWRATSEILVDLLRASLGCGAAPVPARLEKCDWRGLAETATDHGLMPILYGALTAGAAAVPDEWQRKFKASYVANVFHARLAQSSLDEIGAAFAAEAIPLTLVNDAALQCCLYDDPALRIVSKIDVLVDVAAVERASAKLQQLGWSELEQTNERRPLSRYHRLHYNTGAGTVPADLYWRPFEPYQPYVFEPHALRARARPLAPDRPSALRMAPEHELALLCLRWDRRVVAHRSLVERDALLDVLLVPQGGERLVSLYDIALYVQKRGRSIDWDDLVRTARRWAIDGHAGAMLELVRRVLDVAPPPEVLRDLNRGRARWVDRIAQRAMRAAHRADDVPAGGPAARARARRPGRLSTQTLRLARGWLALFPPRAYLRAEYAGSLPGSWALHLRRVMPGLWAETRERLLSAIAGRG